MPPGVQPWPWRYTVVDQQTATRRGQRLLEAAHELVRDTRCVQRHADLQCAPCHQTARTLVARPVTYHCLGCDIEQTATESMQPVLCRMCAEKHGACRHCGADRDLVWREAEEWERCESD